MKMRVASFPSLPSRPGEVRKRLVALPVGLLRKERRVSRCWRRRVLSASTTLRADPTRRPAGTSARPLPRTSSRPAPGRCSPPALRPLTHAEPPAPWFFAAPGLQRGRPAGDAPGPRMLVLPSAGRAAWSSWEPAPSRGGRQVLLCAGGGRRGPCLGKGEFPFRRAGLAPPTVTPRRWGCGCAERSSAADPRSRR